MEQRDRAAVGSGSEPSGPRAAPDHRAGPPAEAEPGADEAGASLARERYRVEGIVPAEPDPRIGHLLAPGEALVSVHPAVVADTRASGDGSAFGAGATGDLYLTSARLVFAGGVLVAYPLGDIEDAVVAGEEVLLVMHDGVGLRVAVAEPRLLRVQIAAARAARRGQVEGRAPYPPSR